MRFLGIDPSTKTGFVARDQGGIVLVQKELTGVGAKDPKRMATAIHEIMAHIKPNDIICIEGFGYASQRAIQMGGIGWGIRMELFKRGIPYYEAAPDAVKKFVSVTGWVGDPGKKRRLKDREKKNAVMQAVEEHFGFTHKSDNVVDAYILSQIAFEIWAFTDEFRQLPAYQAEVIENILTPVTKSKKKVK